MQNELALAKQANVAKPIPCTFTIRYRKRPAYGRMLSK
jgi:hypothetical protein